ncbi:UbiA family prenyltransferase [Tropicimonas sp.]|uniref:UbiA family prenyltransferase n=1 Tax=Tropicimonas sp. TaxID=2067044 RepID=UPI003A8840A5
MSATEHSPERGSGVPATEPRTPAPVLVVDLDGTLLRSDMLLETWWETVSRDLPAALRALARLPAGKAALKQALAQSARVDAASLPYNTDVLNLVRAHRDAGGRVALVTASDSRLAQAIAAHLGCFDEVHASDGALNLKGDNKARFLVERYGREGFDYAGDARADIPVWRAARRAITVNAPAGLRQAAESAAPDALHLGPARASGPVRTWVRACRPHQWAKNVLVFLPVLLSHSSDGRDWLAAGLAFVIFSMVASGVYLLNDLLDLGADRIHPRKRFRPLPSGDMALLHGSLLAPALLVAGLLLSLLLPAPFTLVLAGYFLLTLAYSLSLKRRLIVDICALAALYTLRIIAGAAATGIPPSPWLLAFSSFLFLSLAAVKRQTELIGDFSAGRAGAAGRAYVTDDIPIISGMAIASGYVAVLVMALYVSSPDVAALYSSPSLLWGICPVLLYWISRVVMLAHRGHMHDDPVIFALKDRISLLCGGLVLVLAFAASTL